MTTSVRKIKPGSNPLALMMVCASLFLFGLGWWYGGLELVLAGLLAGGKQLFSVLPWLALAFLVAFLLTRSIRIILPQQTISSWLGAASGWRAIGLACVAGALFPGGPYLYCPVAAVLFQGGASLGVVVAFLSAKNLWSITRLPLEVAILGPELTALRFFATLALPPLLGVLAQAIFGRHVERIRVRTSLPQQIKSRWWQILIWLLITFVLVGYGQTLVSEDLVSTWLGPNSGWWAMLLAEGAGILLPGGPYVSLPLAGMLYQTGASMGITITLITGSMILALPTVAFELPFMGWRFVTVRWLLGLIFPIVSGMLAQLLCRMV